MALDKGDFVGREALAGAGPIDRQIRTLLVGGPDYLPLYGGEAVLVDGVTTGRVRSAAYGHTVERNVAYAYLPADLGAGARLEVEVLGAPVAADLAPDVLVDPQKRRLLG